MPSSNYVFVLTDANARTGVRMEEKDCKVIMAYKRDTRVSDSNGTLLLRLRVTTSLPSSTRSSPSPKDARLVHSMVPDSRIGCIDYIITRQPHRKLVRNATVYLQPRTDSDHNMSCMPESDSPADSLAVENSEPPQGARVLIDE